MKTKSSVIMLLLISLPIFWGNSCEKETKEEINITKSNWKLKSITIDKNLSIPPNEYSLKFTNDSIFEMKLSVNAAGGKYHLESNEKIIIYSYSPLTEICCESDFDNKIVKSFKNITLYSIDGDELVFKGMNEVFVFVKK